MPITFYSSDARNEIFDRESSPTLRKLNSSAFLLIEKRPLVNKEHRSLVIPLFDGTNIETYLNSSLSAIVVTLLFNFCDGYAAVVAIFQDIVDESSSWNSESASQAMYLQFAILVHLSHLLFPSCRPTTNLVASMTDHLPIPCRPVLHLARSQSSTFPGLV